MTDKPPAFCPYGRVVCRDGTVVVDERPTGGDVAITRCFWWMDSAQAPGWCLRLHKDDVTADAMQRVGRQGG
jgi:hypothetical protein